MNSFYLEDDFDDMPYRAPICAPSKRSEMFDDFLAIDFETATPKRHSACALGIVRVKNGEIVDNSYFLIQPPKNEYDRRNVLIHKIFPSKTENEPTIEDLSDQILSLFDGANVVAHKATFDRDVLVKSLTYYNLPLPEFSEWHCTYYMTKQTLDQCCETYNIDFTNHHNALADAMACAKVYLKIRELKGRTATERKKDRLSNLESEIEALLRDVTFPDNSILCGKSIVLTGLFHNFEDRELLSAILTKCGALVKSSISKKTNIVICGEMAGPSKMQKIEELNSTQDASIQIWDEDLIIRTFDENNIIYQF